MVVLANKKVPMWMACDAIGMHVESGSTKKHYCPFGEFSHPDGGDEAAFRVYPEHGFCFACWQYYTPVSLCVAAWEVTEETAAGRLLQLARISPETFEERWEKLQDVPQVDTSAVATALKTRLLREFPRWESVQYNDEVAQYLARCLGLLPAVQTQDDARTWLETCSQVMSLVVGRAQ